MKELLFLPFAIVILIGVFSIIKDTMSSNNNYYKY